MGSILGGLYLYTGTFPLISFTSHKASMNDPTTLLPIDAIDLISYHAHSFRRWSPDRSLWYLSIENESWSDDDVHLSPVPQSDIGINISYFSFSRGEKWIKKQNRFRPRLYIMSRPLQFIKLICWMGVSGKSTNQPASHPSSNKGVTEELNFPLFPSRSFLSSLSQFRVPRLLSVDCIPYSVLLNPVQLVTPPQTSHNDDH